MPEGAALITGGAGGIGRAICERLAADGHAITVADLRAADTEAAARAIAASGRRAAGVACDVTDSASVAAAVEQATSELGPIEILVNNAGWDELHQFVDTDEDFWRRVVEINYMGCLRVTRAVLPGMVERGFGRIVSIASDAARAGSSGEAVYAGAKAGVVAFMKTIAREHARAGITANSVCPGPTRTPMLESMAADEAGAKLIASLERAVPMRRLGEPADVAAAVAFFCSEEAAFITGQTLSVSGGLTMA